jgi:trehalose 6-phosphate synthase/phosphatase
MPEPIVTAYKQAKHRLLLLDYDGTLISLKPHPSLARPTPAILALLRRLSREPSTKVVLISGRDQQTLEAWFGHLPVTLAAEHGSFLKVPAQGWRVLLPHDTTWEQDLRGAMEASAKRVPGSFVEEKATTLVWHYRLGDQRLASLEVRHLIERLHPLVKRYRLALTPGAKIVEVRIVGVDKGAAVRKLSSKQNWDFILAAGDDNTDEDMFRALPESAHTIHVGKRPSLARYRTQSPLRFRKLLRMLAD